MRSARAELRLFLGALSLCTFSSAAHALSAPKEADLSYCRGEVFHATIEIRSSVLLAEKLLPASSEERKKLWPAAAREQLLFLRRFPVEGSGKWLRFFSQHYTEPEIEILEESAAVYPFSVPALDQAESLFGETSAYVKSAVAAASLKAGEPARQVKFRALVPASFCTRAKKFPRSFSIELPKDPYLAYWMVPATGRVEMTFSRLKAAAPPCVDEEFIDVRAPNYLWYFWKPRRKECLRSATARSAILRAPTKVIESAPLRNSREAVLAQTRTAGAEPGPKKATLIFGWIATQAAPESEKERLLRWIESWKAGTQGIYPSGDFSSYSLVTFLNRLGRSWTVTALDAGEKDKIEFTLSHPARHEIRVFWGPTDVLSSTHTPKHWPVLLEALRSSDFVLYTGHSGLGENLNWKRYFPKENFRTGKAEQMIILLSCSALSYFPPELFVHDGNDALKRTLVYNGNDSNFVGRTVSFLIAGFFGDREKNSKASKDPNDDFLIFRKWNR